MKILVVLLYIMIPFCGKCAVQNVTESSHKISSNVSTSPSPQVFSITKAMEGGGIVNLTKSEADEKNDNNETKGKIHPRKGVELKDEKNSTHVEESKNSTHVEESKNSTHVEESKNSTQVKDDLKHSKNSTQVKIEVEPHKIDSKIRIKSRKGVVVAANSTTASPPKKKPTVTMIKEDDSLKDDSFIESTTGRDYVLPIVLSILLFPAIIFLIKLIYKRGTEFTERQQYHRMYLIDGMYNTR